MAKNLDVQIDTASFLESIRPEIPPSASGGEKRETAPAPTDSPAEKKKAARNENRRKPSTASVIPPLENEEDYLEMFIKGAETAARSGKMAYVRREYHDRIMRITRVIGKDKLTLSGYLDHVLTQHFLQCENVIKKLYDKNYEDVF